MIYFLLTASAGKAASSIAARQRVSPAKVTSTKPRQSSSSSTLSSKPKQSSSSGANNKARRSGPETAATSRKSPAGKADLKKPREAANSSGAATKVVRKGFAEGVRDAWRDGTAKTDVNNVKTTTKLSSKKTTALGDSKKKGTEKSTKVSEKTTRNRVPSSASEVSSKKCSSEVKASTPDRPLRLKRTNKPHLKLHIGSSAAGDNNRSSKSPQKVASTKTSGKFRASDTHLEAVTTEREIPRYKHEETSSCRAQQSLDEAVPAKKDGTSSIRCDEHSLHETQEASLHISEDLSTPRTGEEEDNINGAVTKEATQSQPLPHHCWSPRSSDSSIDRSVLSIILTGKLPLCWRFLLLS